LHNIRLLRIMRNTNQPTCYTRLCHALRFAQDGAYKHRSRSLLKSCPEIRTPLDWLPQHGTPRYADVADNFVRNLVKHKKSQFCWETSFATTGASEPQYIVS